jgi:hypothetical protein
MLISQLSPLTSEATKATKTLYYPGRREGGGVDGAAANAIDLLHVTHAYCSVDEHPGDGSASRLPSHEKISLARYS